MLGCLTVWYPNYVDDELVSAVTGLAFAARSLERALEHMTLPQFRVLALIVNAPERASRIADGAAVSRPSVTGILDGLVTKGWVARSDVDGDRRGVTLAITDAGQAAFDDAKRAMTTALDGLVGHTDAKTQAKIINGLVALRHAIRTRDTAQVNA